MLGDLFSALFAGLVVGALGRLVVPGRQAIGCLFTLLIGIVMASVGRFRAKGMSVAALATAASLGVAFVIAVMQPTDEPFVPHIREAIGTAVFAALFLASSALFRKASRER